MNIRDEITAALKRELVGPSPGLPAMQLNREEILAPEDPPRLRYGAGILFPSRVVVQTQEDNVSTADVPQSDDDSRAEDATDRRPNSTGESDPRSDQRGDSAVENDIEVNRSNEFLPSAMGITVLATVPEILTISISTAQYHPVHDKAASFTTKKGKVVKRNSWFRIPMNESIAIDRSELFAKKHVVIEKALNSANANTTLKLHIYCRPGPELSAEQDSATRFITMTLINRTVSDGIPRDQECFYQCEISAKGAEGENCFLNYPEKPLDRNSPMEDQSLALLYRHRKVFAVGHGCAADWEADAENQYTCGKVFSSAIPTYEVKPILPSTLDGINLRMADLANDETESGLQACVELTERYQDWIEQLTKEIEGDVPAHLRKAAEENLSACRSCLQRIRHGIDLLKSDERALEAFLLMNKSMVMQHEHYQLATDSAHKRKWCKTTSGIEPDRPYAKPDYALSTREWRPFQLAFVLMTIRSIVLKDEEDLKERNIVDLIWFPTGGGKTEAYLGLAAFTIFYRRLTDPSNSGTTALMRYTLRLLTTQQFQRAASLICAAEIMRRESPERLGEEPITIGLWVGGSVTPNKEAAAVVSLNSLTGGDKENPFIVLSCPWCGVQMGPSKIGNRTRIKGYRKLTRPNRVRLICEDPNCNFNCGEGLPLQVIDEHIYQSPPTLVIGTVDKFAMMPWNPACRALFGMQRENISPPDLIIQDELHLISGPLGSMVGHYETVIDALTERDTKYGRIAAKIVASTATISRADDQVKRLYGGRGSCLFPAQGLEAGDSFFAKEDTKKDGRLYCGVFATGLASLTTTQVRVLATLLQGGKALDIEDQALLDPYWTLMVYFNSIRELGHAATLVKADIPEYISVICRRLGLSRAWSDEAGEKRRWINEDMELTSRIQNSEITEYMDRLFNRYPGAGNQWPIDVCLATNMIQVGLDVSRLSLMTIIGQPKTTSEYIQASSRVGRSQEGPGLVVTILSPSKPRDRSHAEHFRAFHQSIYRHVEPTSVTPFALPVAERALHALIISLVRFWGNAAETKKPDNPPSEELKQRIRDTILNRVNKVEPEETKRVEQLMESFFAEWDRLPPDIYGYFTPTDKAVPMMYPSGTHPDPDWDDRSTPTPSSMRNVDAACNAFTISHYPE